VSGSFVSPELRTRVRDLVVPVARGFGRLGLTPNHLTLIGFGIAIVAAWAAASQAWLAAGLLVIFGGVFDLFDGALARATGTASKFGAFLDSTLDRTGESLVYAGIAIGCAVIGFIDGVVLAGLAAGFASGVTYTRAKAESLGAHGEVGIAPRAERLVLLAVGLMLADLLGGVGEHWDGFDTTTLMGTYPLALGLGLITILSAITVLQRIVHVRQQLGNDQ
jgi:CDP-diacylglycerol--glycerol-3-phosphate 3-phosphatidyltransferase